MGFGCFQVACGGVDWSFICDIFAPYFDLHLVHILLLGPDIADYVALCEFFILGDLVTGNKKSGISDLNISNALEEADKIAGHSLTLLEFLCISHELKVLL